MAKFSRLQDYKIVVVVDPTTRDGHAQPLDFNSHPETFTTQVPERKGPAAAIPSWSCIVVSTISPVPVFPVKTVTVQIYPHSAPLHQGYSSFSFFQA